MGGSCAEYLVDSAVVTWKLARSLARSPDQLGLGLSKGSETAGACTKTENDNFKRCISITARMNFAQQLASDA